MTEPTRGVRPRRSSRRPGWLLFTVLLVLAIVASSALVFTNKVELLKLAVIISLWAAVVAAFISLIYRRQADVDQARMRDLKLVYDLQLDREISARREYELSVEAQLRRELASELRAQASDEVASLRAELAALRANLEILFDTDLQHRPALETERTAVHTFGVISSRIDTEDPEDPEDPEPSTDESPIIDVPEEPEPPEHEHEWTPTPDAGGAHRRPSEREPAETGWRPAEPPPERRTPSTDFGPPWQPDQPTPASIPPAASTPPPPPPPPPAGPQPQAPAPEPVAPQAPAWQSPEPIGRHAPPAVDWQPAPADGQYIPAGEPGSNWTAPSIGNGSAAVPPPPESTPASPAMGPPPAEAHRGRHGPSDAEGEEARRRTRHSTEAADPGQSAPVLATPPQPPAPPPAPERPSARHREPDEPDEADEPDPDAPPDSGQHAGGQPLSELLARLQVDSTGGGHRRRRAD
jgi:hypothetical protein